MRKPGSARSRQKLSADPLAAGLALLASAAAVAHGGDLRPYTIVGNAIPAALTGTAGDTARGRAIVLDRKLGACLLCHTGPFPEEKFQGTLAPDLSGAGTRWSQGELRLRLVDPTRLNPKTIMPAYYRVEGLTRVGQPWRGKPILTAGQIEDAVAFLSSLRD
jgi:L-cysteine S-thiosulfotransferase